MSDRDNLFRNHTSTLGFLQRLVPETRQQRPRVKSNDFLNVVHSAPAESRAPLDDVDLGRDPAREAAMNQVRRMRIRAA